MANTPTPAQQTPMELAQEVRRLNDVIRVRNGTIDNLKADVAGAAKIITTLRNSHAALQAENERLREALQRFVAAAKSWHNTHNHEGSPVQCDWLCECIAPAEAALTPRLDGEGR